MIKEYKIIDISQYESDSLEPLGTKSKFWYQDDNDKEYLFKSMETRSGYRLGEDWAEKIACELAGLLKLPHAYYELATHKGVRGVITENFISQRGEHFTTGNELLQSFLNTPNDKNPNIQYIDHVYKVMDTMIVGKPIGFDSFFNIKSASEFFVGYLMFDVLVSNQDRHNENWGRISTPKGTNHLAPSYDHGASLARNINDDDRQNKLLSKDQGQHVSTYVQKTRSQFHEPNGTKKRLKLIEAFKQYALKERVAAKLWLNILNEVQDIDIMNLISKVPDSLMTQVSKDFTYRLIICNKANLLKLYDEFSNGN